MLVVVLAMLLIVFAGALVVAYVAFPARGREVPHAAWLGPALERAAGRIGVDEQDEQRERTIRR